MGWVKDIAAIIDALGAQGSLAFGVGLGFVITAWANWMAGSERRARLQLDFELMKELRAQLVQKDQRISALHDELRNQITSMAPGGGNGDGVGGERATNSRQG